MAHNSKSMIMIVALLFCGWNWAGKHAFCSEKTGEMLQQEQQAFENELQRELNQLKAAKPELFKNRDLTPFIRGSVATKREADLLFLAAELCHYELDKLCQTFPGFCTIYTPIFIGDMDHDHDNEIVVLGFTQLRFDNMTEIVLFEKEESTIAIYSQSIPRIGMDVSVTSLSDGELYIVAEVLGKRVIEIVGKNRLATILFTEDTVLRFTGTAIEVVNPLRVVDEKVMLDE